MLERLQTRGLRHVRELLRTVRLLDPLFQNFQQTEASLRRRPESLRRRWSLEEGDFHHQ